MKRYYVFLAIIFVLLEAAAVCLSDINIAFIIGMSVFLICYILTCISAGNETVTYQDAVLKIKEKAPFIVPIVLFTIPSLICGAVFLSNNTKLFVLFVAILAAGIGFYFIAIVLLISGLKKSRGQQKISCGDAAPNKLKLLLINPVNPVKTGLTVNQSSVFPPLGLGIIADLTPSDLFEIKLIDENLEPFSYEKADLVAITAFTSAANRAYELAKIYRQKGVPVIMGGIHASMLPAEAQNFADAVVTGEAENIWKNVIDDFLKGQLQPVYHGGHADLGRFSVNRDIFSDKYFFASVQTSRGCPMDCYFCSVTAFNGRAFRQRPYEDVLDELALLPQKMIFFVDDNLIGYGSECEERALKLFKGMVERKLNKEWFCQASLNFAKNEEVVQWAAKSGCKMVFLGLESADPIELKYMGKNLNLIYDYKKAFKLINKYGIAVLGAFIFGSDNETEESMRRKTEFILKNRIDVIQSTILTPLPGTRLYNQYDDENRLMYKNFPSNWNRYDMSELTYKMKGMENELFLKTLKQCHNKLYSRRTLLRKFLLTLLHTRSMNTALWAYRSNTNYKNASMS